MTLRIYAIKPILRPTESPHVFEHSEFGIKRGLLLIQNGKARYLRIKTFQRKEVRQ